MAAEMEGPILLGLEVGVDVSGLVAGAAEDPAVLGLEVSGELVTGAAVIGNEETGAIEGPGVLGVEEGSEVGNRVAPAAVGVRVSGMPVGDPLSGE